MVDCQLVADDRWVHTGVNGSPALCVIALPVQSQAIGVKACPVSGAQVYLQRDHTGATLYHQIIVVLKKMKVLMSSKLQRTEDCLTSGR